MNSNRGGGAAIQLRVTGLLFLSGASSLAYEVAWTRSLAGVFGVALHATTAVLVAYMAGLSLGGLVGGRVAPRIRAPLRAYAALEAAIGASALLVPLGLSAVGGLYGWLYEPLLERPGLGFAIRFLGSLAVLLVPTTLMGATLPIAAEGCVRGGDRLGADAGRLYAANTAGAVLGVAATGLVLLPALGVSLTNQVSAAVSVAVALLALALVGRAGERLEGPSEPAPAAPEARGGAARRRPERGARGPSGEERLDAEGAPARLRATLVLAGLSGFVALSLEIVWTHVLAAVTRDTTVAFTCTLAAFLTGIALGGWLGARLSARVGPRARAAIGLAACQAGVALSGLLSFAVMRWLGGTAQLAPPGSFGAAVAQQLAFAALPMLVPTCLLGASLPLCLTLAGRARPGGAASGSGRAVGAVLSANTLGAVLGCVASGLWLVPSFGFGKSTVLLSAAALGGALLALRLHGSADGPGSLRLGSRLAYGALLAELFLVLPAASTAWFFPAPSAGGRVVFHAEDASGIVDVVEEEGVRTLITDRRHRWGSTHPAMVQSMLRQGALPLLLHPRPARMVEIGLATGIHALPQLRDSRVEELTVVEISPAVLGAAGAFAGHNGGLLNDPRVRVVLDDGRSFLQRTRRRFDVIVLGLFVPYRPGASALYSRELLAACRERLDRGGLVFEWLPLDQMTFDAVRSVMATFLAVFPHVEAWEKGQYLALVGASEPAALDAARMREGLRGLGGARATGLRDPADVVASHLLGPAQIRALAEGAPLNTDDRPRIEFMRGIEGTGYGQAVRSLERLLERRALPAGVAAWPDAERAAAERRFLARGRSLRGALLQARGQHRDAYAEFAEALRADPEDEIARGEVARYDEALRRSSR
ncbi:fused MFS/spermidine synthase [Sorangium sp. So ce1078]|uniref:fused MFS/spermidine synthase n=1 Tax=Sorangium sp. So ce1078 TaxID=3133329 RepID=UPI003F5D9A3D